jgi:hypothetical protein
MHDSITKEGADLFGPDSYHVNTLQVVPMKANRRWAYQLSTPARWEVWRVSEAVYTALEDTDTIILFVEVDRTPVEIDGELCRIVTVIAKEAE